MIYKLVSVNCTEKIKEYLKPGNYFLEIPNETGYWHKILSVKDGDITYTVSLPNRIITFNYKMFEGWLHAYGSFTFKVEVGVSKKEYLFMTDY